MHLKAQLQASTPNDGGDWDERNDESENETVQMKTPVMLQLDFFSVKVKKTENIYMGRNCCSALQKEFFGYRVENRNQKARRSRVVNNYVKDQDNLN